MLLFLGLVSSPGLLILHQLLALAGLVCLLGLIGLVGFLALVGLVESFWLLWLDPVQFHNVDRQRSMFLEQMADSISSQR